MFIDSCCCDRPVTLKVGGGSGGGPGGGFNYTLRFFRVKYAQGTLGKRRGCGLYR